MRINQLSSSLALAALITFVSTSRTVSQVRILVDPNPLVLQVGETAAANVTVLGTDGSPLQGADTLLIWQAFGPSVLRSEGLVPSSGAEIDSLGNITGRVPGTYNAAIIFVGNAQEKFAVDYLVVEVVNAQASTITIENLPEKLYAGTSIPLKINVLDEMGFKIDPKNVSISTSNTKIASVDELGNLYLHGVGNTQLLTKAGLVENTLDLRITENPVTEIELSTTDSYVRTGDVVSFSQTCLDKKGNVVEDVPVIFGFNSRIAEEAAGASGFISPDGNFVAEKPGIYTIIASTGRASAIYNVQVEARDVRRETELVGKGIISDKHTSDLWVWEGVDGRDYAVTGTWGADGTAYFWDVTNPGNIIKIDSVQVDARTVNDVKVSEDGKICVISREGASNRKNGIVILDVSNPRDVKELSTYTQDLTGGVHNLFIYKEHVYALSNGQRYEIINIENPANPQRVSRFEIGNPARSIHDVWVVDGIAYSSNWNDGVILVDVGNGMKGGTPKQPVEIMRAKVQGDANHAAFPFRSTSTGRFYVIAGDEIFPRSFNPQSVTIPSGYIHFIDITDPNNPVEVARYEVPEAGSHNLWVEDDLLYIGYYNAGVRVVDISGLLMGDLYRQGREVASYLPLDPDGTIPNAAMTWGAQPHKGHIFFSDFNSGLWSVKMKPPKPQEATVEIK